MARLPLLARLGTVVVIALVAAGWFAGVQAVQADPVSAEEWDALRRPLQVPVLEPGTACPALPPRPVPAEVAAVLAGEPALGTFPIFAKGELTADGERRFGLGQQDPWGWVRYKTIWYGHPGYDGPLLVRAVRLDGESPVRLEGSDLAGDGAELRLAGDNAGSSGRGPGWRLWNTVTAVEAPGCYAWQIDGRDFTQVVVVEVPA